MKKTTFLAAMCCSLLTIGTVRAELPTPVLDAPLDEASAETVPTWKNAAGVSAEFKVPGNPWGTPKVDGANPGVEVDATHGNVRTFNGAANKLETKVPIAISGSVARTITYWAKMNWGGGAPHQVFAMGGSDANRFFVHINSEGTAIEFNSAYGFASNNKVRFENADKPFKDVWAHFAFVIKEGAVGSEMEVYVNGDLWSNGVATPTELALNTKGGSLIIGNAMNASMCKIKVYDVALSAEQVEELSGGSATGIEANKLASRIEVSGKNIFVNGTADIQIYDVTGRLALQRSNVRGQMSVENLTGIYMIRANVDGQIATVKAAF